MQILEELYYGNIRPDVKFHGEASPLAELARLRERNRDKLFETLNEAEKEIFEKFSDAQTELCDISNYEKFVYGLKLGVLLMTEVFTGT